jgi:exodeoxyribonuclease X
MNADVFAVIDLETTGLTPPAAVIEIGIALRDYAGRQTYVQGTISKLFSPGDQEITPENRAIHHINPAWLKDKPVFNAEGLHFATHAPYWVAHNAAFERQFIDPMIQPMLDAGHLKRAPIWICTKKCAVRQWPHFNSHSNQVLRYALPIPHCTHVEFDPPHRAAPDAMVTAEILKMLLQHQTAETLARWTAEPLLFLRLPFGKHKGKPLAEVPPDYLDWMLKQSDIDADVRFTCETELARRAALEMAQ